MRQGILFFGFIFGFSAWGQMLTPTVVASSGEFFTSSSASLSWTLGESAVDTYIGVNNQLTQGFQQPDIRFSSVDEVVNEPEFSIYPNPSSGVFDLRINDLSEPISISVIDISGKEIWSKNQTSESNVQIDISNFARGIYFVKIYDENNFVKTIKIEKL